MNNKAPALDWIEPPSGGMHKLHDRIARRKRRRFIAIGCAVMAVAAGTLMHVSLNVNSIEQPFDDLIARHAATKAGTRPPLRVIDGAALELPSPSSNARIYLVSTMPKEPPQGSG